MTLRMTLRPPFSSVEFGDFVRSRFSVDSGLMIEPAGLRFSDEHRSASVLVLVFGDPARIILTRRTDDLPSHGGQISFPGGKLESGESATDAALREANEEVGLLVDLVDVVGVFGPYYSPTGFCITPVLGVVEGIPKLTRNESEVSEIFDVPVSFLMDLSNHIEERREVLGRMITAYSLDWSGHHIWGVTAGIIRMIRERIYVED